MGLNQHIYSEVDADEPVTRRECSLLRKMLDDRVRSVETDLKEIKLELRTIKTDLDKFYDKQESKWERLWILILIILVLVAMGRVLDLESVLKILI